VARNIPLTGKKRSIDRKDTLTGDYQRDCAPLIRSVLNGI